MKRPCSCDQESPKTSVEQFVNGFDWTRQQTIDAAISGCGMYRKTRSKRRFVVDIFAQTVNVLFTNFPANVARGQAVV